MNVLTESIKKNLKVSLLGGLAAMTTIVSGYQHQSNTMPLNSASYNEIKNSNKGSNAFETISIEIERKGALYISLEDNLLFLWMIENHSDEFQEVYLYDRVDLGDSTDLKRILVKVFGVSSIFYSEKVLDRIKSQNLKLNISGFFDKGKLITPLKAEIFEPLLHVESSEPKPIEAYDGVFDLYETQKKIYEQVNKSMDLTQYTTTRALDKSESLLRDYSSSQLERSYQVKDMLSSLEVSSVDKANLLLSNVQEDIGKVNVNIEGRDRYIAKKTKKDYIQCANNIQKDVDINLTDFEELVSIYEDDFNNKSSTKGRPVDPIDDPVDELSEEQELVNDQFVTSMQNCLGSEQDIETISNDTYEFPMSENGHYQQLENLETEFNYVEQEVKELGDSLIAEGEQKVRNADDLVDLRKMDEIQHGFDNWIPESVLKNKVDAINPLVSISEKGSDEKGGNEVLCENYTNYDIEFDVFGVGVLIATSLNDSIKTGDENNLIITFGGEDCIESHDGIDFVFSGADNDIVYGGDDIDFLFSGKGDDEVHGSAGRKLEFANFTYYQGNFIFGSQGKDTLYGGEDNKDRGENNEVETKGFTDFIFGGSDNDEIHGERGIDFIFGSEGDDTLKNEHVGYIEIQNQEIAMGSFFFGGRGDDTIIGSNSSGTEIKQLLGDFIFGNIGNDKLNGRGGIDFIFGNSDNDTISGGKNTDLIFGNQGNDSVSGNDGIDLVSGDSGSDYVYGNSGLFDLLLGGKEADYIYGGDGVDLIFGSQGSDNIEGNDGIDLIFAGSENDTVSGGNQEDLIFGSSGYDILNGNDGVDFILGGKHGDTINGGNGTDVLFGNTNLKDVPDTIHGGNGIDVIFGNSGIDHLFGGNDTDVIFGNSGDDVIHGESGVDFLLGNSGNDIIEGGDDKDVILGGSGNDNMSGGASEDLMLGNTGCDTINGNDGMDFIFGNSGADLIYAGSGNDIVFGNSGNDLLYGEDGEDLLIGNSDNDYINSGNGKGLLFGNEGNDHIIGGNSRDVIFGNNGKDYINGGNGNDAIIGNQGDDIINGEGGNDIIFGNRGNDKINAGSGKDYVWGNRGNDRLRGVEGRNYVWGNRDDDVLDGYLHGSDPKDKLRGNRHRDTLTGNSSNTRDKLKGGWGSDNILRNVTLISISEFAEPTYPKDQCLK